MSWRNAKATIKLRDQINELFPNRDKASDGTIGDARHRKTKSDHNPNSRGVVTAIDIDKDLSSTVKINRFVDALVASRDKRIKYIIFEGRIVSSQVQPWVWRKYTGANGHFAHMHLSVMDDPKLYDDDSPWDLGTSAADIPAAAPVPETPTEQTARMILRRGDRGDDIKEIQRKLKVAADGIFGVKTEQAVKALQRQYKLKVDGVVGAKTLAVLARL